VGQANQLDHQLTGRERHLVRAPDESSEIRQGTLLGEENEKTIGDRWADERIHVPVGFYLLDGLGLFPVIDHLYPQHDIIDGPSLPLALVLHVVI